MAINDQIRDEKLQYDINVEVTKISALSSGNVEDILPSSQQQIIEQTNLLIPLWKRF